MRASRLLQILLILQNRGRQTAARLAAELEVAPRTILRDVDAMTEAGLPIIVHQGNRGGIELGFNYRSRLTGLATEEAEALGILLSLETPLIDAAGLRKPARQMRLKLIEGLPERARTAARMAMARFQIEQSAPKMDARIEPLALAVRSRHVVRIRSRDRNAQIVHPVGLVLTDAGWMLKDALTGARIALADWGDVNITSAVFTAPAPHDPS